MGMNLSGPVLKAFIYWHGWNRKLLVQVVIVLLRTRLFYKWFVVGPRCGIRGCVRLLVRTGLDRYQKHSFIGTVGIGPFNESGLVWNYPTVGPQSGAGMARTVRLLRTVPVSIRLNKRTHPEWLELFVYVDRSSTKLKWSAVNEMNAHRVSAYLCTIIDMISYDEVVHMYVPENLLSFSSLVLIIRSIF
jgi:hypothetical protein